MKETLPYRAMRPTEEDLAIFRESFEANGFPRDLRQVRWQYLEHPGEQLLVDFAFDARADGEKVAGIYAALPFLLKVGDEDRLAGQALDVLTDYNYRGRGLFTGLARSLYARCAEHGHAFIYGFPNANTANGYWTRLDWTNLGPVPFLIRPLRTRYLLERVPGIRRAAGRLPDIPLPLPRAPRSDAGGEIRPVHKFDARFDRLWKVFSREVHVGVRRDSRYLTWRFIDKPLENYLIYGLFDAQDLLGFVVYCVKRKHGGVVGYVMELMHDLRWPDAAEQLARWAVRDIGRQGADVVLAWSFGHSPNHRAFRRTGFLPLPEWARPIELHFGARSLDPSVHQLIANRNNWYISYADSDTV